ncbi:hypothetical protein PIIN_11064 [Serendipita indica DSM 11827]|uniref:Uncharacterized protein n=1 Tax=Serendipita indica (strain DSM 11827) TaxID=1109443 RepID=G4U0I6_SERID|nr:hypothetical protein PIIN_11064 [Serendipita indica DSM 11827]
MDPKASSLVEMVKSTMSLRPDLLG